MPPAKLTEEMYCLWRSDLKLQEAFPWIEKGDPHHSSQAFTFHERWKEWETTHPEIIQHAKELLAAEKGTAPPLALSSSSVPMALPVNNDELVKAITKLTEAVEQLAPTKEQLKKNPIVQKLIEEAIDEKCSDCKPDGDE